MERALKKGERNTLSPAVVGVASKGLRRKHRVCAQYTLTRLQFVRSLAGTNVVAYYALMRSTGEEWYAITVNLSLGQVSICFNEMTMNFYDAPLSVKFLLSNNKLDHGK